MLLKKLSVLVSTLLISCMAFSAQNQQDINKTDKVMKAFLACDNQFFKQLALYKDDFNQYVDLATADNVTYIPVESIENHDKNKVMFKKPFQYRGLTISGYQNVYLTTTASGQFYYWGFIVDNAIDDVKNALDTLHWSKFNAQIYTANTKIYDTQSHSPNWQDNPYSIDGVLPKIGTIEKSLYLEPISDKQSLVSCSIQGDVDKQILYVTRPDIKPIFKKMELERKQKLKLDNKQKEIEQKRQFQPQVKPNQSLKNN